MVKLKGLFVEHHIFALFMGNLENNWENFCIVNEDFFPQNQHCSTDTCQIQGFTGAEA